MEDNMVRRILFHTVSCFWMSLRPSNANPNLEYREIVARSETWRGFCSDFGNHIEVFAVPYYDSSRACYIQEWCEHFGRSKPSNGTIFSPMITVSSKKIKSLFVQLILYRTVFLSTRMICHICTTPNSLDLNII